MNDVADGMEVRKRRVVVKIFIVRCACAVLRNERGEVADNTPKGCISCL